MFRNLLRPDSGLMITMSQITDCIFLSLFFLLGCFPVITAGASIAALYDGVFHAFRKGGRHSWQRFLHTFRTSLKASLIPVLVFFAIAAAAGWVMIQLWNAAAVGSLSWMVFSAAGLVGFLVLGMLSLLFPMLSRFENTTPVLLKNTLLLSLANLPRTLLLGVLNGISIWLCFRYVFPLFFLPALAALLGSLLIEPMFRPYLPAEVSAAETVPTLEES